MDLDLAEFAVKHAVSLGAKYADVRLETTKKNDFILKNGVPQMAGFDRVQGLGIKLNAEGCFGFAATNELDKEKIKQFPVFGIYFDSICTYFLIFTEVSVRNGRRLLGMCKVLYRGFYSLLFAKQRI